MRVMRVVLTTLCCLLSTAFVGCGGELATGAQVPASAGTEPQMKYVSTEETGSSSPEGISHWNVYEDEEGLFFRVRGLEKSGEEVTDLWIPQELAYAGDELGKAELDCLLQTELMANPDGSPRALQEEGNVTASDYCWDEYQKCVAGCRRMRSPRARAICYSACMARYAACRRGWGD